MGQPTDERAGMKINDVKQRFRKLKFSTEKENRKSG